MVKRTLLQLALLLLAVHASGETLVTLERDGQPVANGEICWFPAGDREDPFRRWLSSQAVTCVAAGPITFPHGLWNVYGKLEGKAVSSSELVDGTNAPEKLLLTLAPGAAIVPQLPPQRTAVLYVPQRGLAFPLPAGAQRLTVPASEGVWAILMEKGQPVSLVPIPALDAETERAIDLQGSPGGPFVLGWLQVPENDRVAVSKAQSLSTPRIHLTVGGSSRESDPLPPLALLHGSFFLVRGVTAGEAELEVAGRGWIHNRSRVKIDTRIVTVATAPLLARVSASLLVRWGSWDDLPALDRELGSCNRNDGGRTPLVEISIAACSRVYGDTSGADELPCTVIREESFVPELKFGSFAVDDLAPGEYRAELRFGRLPPIRNHVTLRALQQQHVSLQARYYEMYGTVTHGGEPLREGAMLKLPGGVGFAERETGQYRAVLLAPFNTDTRIDINACDGGLEAFVLAPQGFSPHARFDLDIPDNQLVITVVDTFTRTPLSGATVSYSVMSRNARRGPVFTGMLTTSGQPSKLLSVPERELRITVTRTGYEKQVIKPFTMPRSGTETLDVELVPLRGSSGRIVSPTPFERASVYWFFANGEETEHAALERDGTFVFSGDHGPDETMAVVSLSHPLWVLRSPSMRRGETVTLPFPNVPFRTFDLTLPGTDPQVSTYAGLVIGGVRVPFPALRLHQTLRKLPALVPGSGPLQIAMLMETGPIEAYAGPSLVEVPLRTGIADPTALPQFATRPRSRLLPGMTTLALTR